MRGERVSKLYQVKFSPHESGREDEEDVAMAESDTGVRLWYARLGHVGRDRLSRLEQVVNRGPHFEQKETELGVCEGCVRGKLTVAQFARTSGSEVKTNKALEAIYSDLMGPMETPLKGGAPYVLVLVDDWSRYVQVYLLKAKNKVLE